MNEKRHINIAIDGPSGAGKSSVAKQVAKRLGIVYVDTGAMYRAIGLYVYRKGAQPTCAEQVIPLLDDINITLGYDNGEQKVFLNGEDVSTQIRQNEISMYASAVSAIPAVRAFLLDMQRDMAKNHSVVMDGRDIGTVILPNADLKIYMTASTENRAERRYLELRAKGSDISFAEVLSDMIERDKNDSSRECAPAVAADDAVLFDNTGYQLEESVEYVCSLIRDKLDV